MQALLVAAPSALPTHTHAGTSCCRPFRPANAHTKHAHHSPIHLPLSLRASVVHSHPNLAVHALPSAACRLPPPHSYPNLAVHAL
eukprot:355418-Chlamydomonas_euryale.AAC.5